MGFPLNPGYSKNLLCPCCGLLDEDNVGAARRMEDEESTFFHCGRCGGKYYFRKCVSYYTEEAFE